jgi:hypothetical protein
MADDATPICPTDYGLVFGGSKTMLQGRVSNINPPSDVAVAAARAIMLTNRRGAVLELSGRQVGLMANVDLRGWRLR